ncbi:hypothetical protein CO47_0110 [Enterococcus phage AUEF3]|uniref:Uncharacterized protein n=1 Tax=Enterococcus phage AUEF3 TaxID=1476978 RepID=X2KRY9_9CAUD|nr:hypothetical protein FDJ59_gp15 [Enterococcus phage AUEF3]AHN83281.1 hypothetical protein CO47_0110 [Enterococcus phage AUEF3]
MIIKEDLLRCTYFSKDLKEGSITFKKLVERRNKHNAPEFDFDHTKFYVESMEVEYKTNDYHIMRAILVTMEGTTKYAGGRFNLEVDYNANTMLLEEI